VSENISVLRLQGDQLLWLRAGDRQARDLSDGDVAAQLQAELRQRGHRVLFAVPGAEARLLTQPVTRDERRHLAASLPFMLEESVAEDIETLHFARAELTPDRFAVAVLRREQMLHWQARLADWPALGPWVPEPLLLPWEPGNWVLLCEAGRVLLRYGECSGSALESSLAPVLLGALAAEAAPERIVVYGENETEDRALLPPPLAERVEWRRGGLGAALLLSEASPPLLDLRQGDFAPQLPYRNWWQQWRAVAALLALAVGLHVLGGWLDLRRLEADNLALRGEIERRYRDVNPRGALVDAEKQLRRQLDALGGGEASGFSRVLGPLGRLMAQRTDNALASLNYSQGSGELRVNLLAPDFDAVEDIRAGLVNAGLDATLENSSRAGEGVRARLRIDEGPSS
jgi:general secretion pathway protein L